MKKPTVEEIDNVTCKVCHYADHTGFPWPHDLDGDYHEGITVGNGKTMYWMMIWHGGSGNVTLFSKENVKRRYLSGDAIVTIHFKPDGRDAIKTKLGKFK